MRRENNYIESYKSLNENKNRRISEKEKLVAEAVAQRENFLKDYYSIRENREMTQRRHGKLMEACRNDAFGSIIKAIYITALEAHSLTDNGLVLAENMVDTWIKESGGAYKILNNCKDKTYLLNRISNIVEQVALIETDAVENPDITDDDSADTSSTPEDIGEVPTDDTSSSSDGNEELSLAAKIIEKKVDSSDPEIQLALNVIKKHTGGSTDSETSPTDDIESEISDDGKTSTDTEEEISPDDIGEIEEDKDSDDSKEEKDDSEKKEDEEKSATDDIEDEISDDGTTSTDDSDESDDETDVADDITDGEDVPEEDVTVDGDSENNGKVFDELDKEEDVKKAIDVIRQRVADAEQTFIKKNAEDKKAIDELIGRISDNVKTVEDIADADNAESKVAEESARICKQKIDAIREQRALTVLEKLNRNLYSNIIKDKSLREQYLTESGDVDTDLIVESAKVMYGFLETLNTLQLEKVDAGYIKNILDNM